MRVIVYGLGKEVYSVVHFLLNVSGYKLVGLYDARRYNEILVVDSQIFCVHNPDTLCKTDVDRVFIVVNRAKSAEEIERKLLDMGFDSDSIVSYMSSREFRFDVMAASRTYTPNHARVSWLRDYSLLAKDIPGSVAEAGVYQGDFSYYINKYFYDRKMLLFDTFSGFDKRDVCKERELNDENFLHSSYNSTSAFSNNNVDIVKEKLVYPDNCSFYVGWFPDSARDVDEKFCFVSLDMDLYQPMLSGLEFFYDKMSSGGVIMLHDYFHHELPGVKKAVEDFEKSRGVVLKKCVVGDLCSLLIIC